MKFSKKMMIAHAKTLGAYEKLIGILENEGVSDHNKRDAVGKFYKGECNYCMVFSSPDMPPRCESCILTTRKNVQYECVSGLVALKTRNDAWDCYVFHNNYTIKEMTERFIERHGWLALQAEYNLTDRKE